MIETDKIILDATAGARMMHFDKNNPLVLFIDIRDEEHQLCDGRWIVVRPDLLMDYTNQQFADNTFFLTVFDPSHFTKLGENSYMAKKYGVLPLDWKTLIKSGFDECMRTLKPGGTLIFKWNEAQIPVKEIIKIIGVNPIFGHPTGRSGKTVWMAFIKPPHNN